MREFIAEQLSVSTAEEERNYFSAEPPLLKWPDTNAILPAGLYRVIDGRLYRVVEGIPPAVRLRHAESDGR
jgi:hypothetical protein